MNIRILSLDTGTANTAYAFLIGDLKAINLHTFGMVKTTKKENGIEVPVRERIDRIGSRLISITEMLNPTHVAFEDFTEQGKFIGKTYKEMAWLTEHLRMLFKELGHEPSIFENGYWKKQLMGAMRVNKHQVQHYVSHRLPKTKVLLANQPDHVWDSIGVGLCQYKLLQRGN